MWRQFNGFPPSIKTQGSDGAATTR
jgi:hypothetical protein